MGRTGWKEVLLTEEMMERLKLLKVTMKKKTYNEVINELVKDSKK
jgi:hypothetical protein